MCILHYELEKALAETESQGPLEVERSEPSVNKHVDFHCRVLVGRDTGHIKGSRRALYPSNPPACLSCLFSIVVSSSVVPDFSPRDGEGRYLG